MSLPALRYDHYSADITRTLPVGGKFTKEQADIYRIVYDAQQECIRNVRPGRFVGTRRDAVISKSIVIGNGVPHKHIYLPAVARASTGGGQ